MNQLGTGSSRPSETGRATQEGSLAVDQLTAGASVSQLPPPRRRVAGSARGVVTSLPTRVLAARFSSRRPAVASSLAAVRRVHAAPVPNTPAAVAGAAVVIPAGIASPTVAAIASATPTTVVATTVSDAAVAGAVDVGGLVRQIVGVLQGGRPEDTRGCGRVGARERATEDAHDDGKVLGEL